MPKPRPTIAILHFLIIEVCCRICPDEWVEKSAEHCDLCRTGQDVYAVNGYGADDGGACVDVLYENVGHLE